MTLAAAATGLYAIHVALLLALHWHNRDYSPVRHAVSDYAVGKSAALFRIYGGVGVAGTLALAWLFHASEAPAFPGRVPVYLVAMAIARVGAVAFPTDLEGATATAHGRMHFLCAIATFALVYMTIDVATPILSADPRAPALHAVWPALRWIATIALAGVVLTMFKPARAIFGLIERVFLFSTAIWLLLAAVWFTFG
jgi:hypothetical protein